MQIFTSSTLKWNQGKVSLFFGILPNEAVGSFESARKNKHQINETSITKRSAYARQPTPTRSIVTPLHRKRHKNKQHASAGEQKNTINLGLTSVPGVCVEDLFALFPSQNVDSVLVHDHTVIGARPRRLSTKQLLQLVKRIADTARATTTKTKINVCMLSKRLKTLWKRTNNNTMATQRQHTMPSHFIIIDLT